MNALISCVLLLAATYVNGQSYYTYEPSSSQADCGEDATNACSPFYWDTIHSDCSADNSWQQSPINIVSSAVTRSPYMSGPVADVSGACRSWAQRVSEGTVIVQYESFCENYYVVYNDANYTLDSIEFHSVSEHAIGGGRFDGEAQFVHTSENVDGTTSTLIVAVLLRVSTVAGTDNDFLTDVIDDFYVSGSLENNRVLTSQPVAHNPYTSFTPGNPAQYYYQGSTTSPPCKAGVDWFIFEQPVFISAEQRSSLMTIMALSDVTVNNETYSFVDENGNNARPLQVLQDGTSVMYIPGGAVEPMAEEDDSAPTMAPSQEHHMPQNAIIVGSVAIALSGVLLLVTIVLFFMVAKNHTTAVNNEMHQLQEGSEALL